MSLDDPFIDVSPEAIIGIDADLIVCTFNRAAERLLGYSAAEIVGRSVLTLVPDRLTSAVRETIADFIGGGQTAGHYREWLIRRQDGAEVLVEIAAAILKLGDEIYYLASLHDISARHQLETRLLQLSRAVEQSPSTIVITDLEGRIQYVNPRFVQLTGYAVDEVLGQNPRILKSGETPPEEYRRLWQTISAGREWRGEFHNRKKSGELYWESASISPIFNAQQIIIGYVAVKEDITARKAAEAALRDERDLFAALVDTVDALVILLDSDGRIVRFNHACERVTGYTSAELCGRFYWEILIPPEAQADNAAAFPVSRPDQVAVRYRNDWLTRTGQRRTIEWSNAILPDEQGGIKFIVGTGLDVTEQLHTLESLRRTVADHRALINGIPDLIFRLSRDGTFLDFKPSDQVPLYSEPTHFLGRPVAEVLPGEVARKILDGIAHLADAGRGRSHTIEYELPVQGELRSFEGRLVANGPDDVLLLVRDITDRTRAEAAEHEQRVLAEALRDTVAAVNSTLNLDTVLDHILENVGRVVPHDAANIMLLDGDQAYVARARGYAERGLNEWIMSLRTPVNDLFSLNRLSNSGQTVLIADTRTSPDWVDLPQTAWVRSYVGAPIQIQGEVRGFLHLDSAVPNFFTPTHAERLAAFANQAALAVGNAQRLAETRRLAERERLVNQITNRIRNTMDLDAIIRTTVEELGRLFGASRCFIRLGADANYMPVAAEVDQPGVEPIKDKSPGLLPGTRARIMARSTFVVDDTRVSQPALYQAGVRAVLAVPLLVRQNLLGALTFHECYRPRRWLSEEIELVETLAAQVGIAIENARLYHETRRQLGELAILHTAAIATAESASLTEALRKVAQSVYDAFSDVSVAVLLTQPEADELVVRAGAGLAITEAERLRIKIGQGITGWVAQTGQPALVPDVTGDPRYLPFDPEVRSELCVPLRSGARVIGVLNVESRQLDAFSERDLQLLTTLAHNLTIIVDNIRLLEEVRAANDRLQELDRLKTQFLANISHELRTPLNAIIGFSDLIGDGVAGPLTPDQRAYAGNINASGRHLLALINDILDLSKIQAGRMTLDRQAVSVADLIAEAHTFIEPLIHRKQQTLVIDAPGDLPPVNVDPLRIKQVLINLLNNACKFTPDHGTVTVRARADGDRLTVTVSDTGRGIPPDQQTAIFEEFRQVETAEDKHEGSGLGLAIARRLIELHGGQIWVDSAGLSGQGSTFAFSLPLETGAARTDQLQPVAVIVEDDRDFSNLLALHLQQAGFQTRQCYSGADALDVIREAQPSLITLDMILPGKDGWTILREIKAAPELRHTGVVIISGAEHAPEAAQAGQVEYVPKPLLKTNLLEAMERLRAQYPQRALRVLVIDDDPMLTELIRAMLTPPDYEVTVAIDGVHAIDQITASPPDIVILDLLMPNMNGFDVLQALRADPHTRDLPALVLTAKSLSPQEELILSQAAQGVMLKTQLRRDRLLAEIRRVQQRIAG
jgi:PAS domain S-box-containing protein